jgi:hypothetical protein
MAALHHGGAAYMTAPMAALHYGLLMTALCYDGAVLWRRRTMAMLPI